MNISELLYIRINTLRKILVAKGIVTEEGLNETFKEAMEEYSKLAAEIASSRKWWEVWK